MANTEDGGPAFPTPNIPDPTPDRPTRVYYEGSGGMTLRDYFAGQVLAGMHARDVYDEGQATSAQRARIAYLDADALLKERTK